MKVKAVSFGRLFHFIEFFNFSLKHRGVFTGHKIAKYLNILLFAGINQSLNVGCFIFASYNG